MSTRQKVWFNKTTAIIWIVAGILAFVFGWQDAVWFVVVASVYANVKADWSTAEAADDRELKALLTEILEKLDGNCYPSSCDCQSGLLSGGDGTNPNSSEPGSLGSFPRVAGGAAEPDRVQGGLLEGPEKL